LPAILALTEVMPQLGRAGGGSSSAAKRRLTIANIRFVLCMKKVSILQPVH
jgi:hypothetical protein